MFSKLFGNKHLIIILLSIIILVIVMGLTLDSRNLIMPEKLLKDSISWTQSMFYIPANAIAGFFQDIHDYTIIFKEDKALKYSLNQYTQVVAELNQLKSENSRLKEMLDYKEHFMNEYQLAVAKVIARSPDRWNNMIVINKGSNDGIKKDMAVITTKGFIGKVYSVSNFSANVQLITDIDHNGFVFASIQSDPASYGVVEGYDVSKNQLSVAKIDLNAKVESGQLVTTSDLGGVFPNGLAIGKIISIEEGKNGGLTKTALVAPAADFYHLDEVFVVIKAEDPLMKGEEK